MNADGTTLRQLTDSPGRDVWPDWFPNGRQIAFTSDRTGVPNVYVMNVDGSDQRALLDDPEFGTLEPDVAPNGGCVVEAAQRARRHLGDEQRRDRTVQRHQHPVGVRGLSRLASGASAAVARAQLAPRWNIVSSQTASAGLCRTM